MTCWRLDSGSASLVLAGQNGRLALAYLGARLPKDVMPDWRPPPVPPNSPDDGAGAVTLWPANGWGFGGEPGLTADGHPDLRLVDAVGDAASLRFHMSCKDSSLLLDVQVRAEQGLFVWQVRLTNNGTAPLRCDWLASLALPLPGWVTTATLYGGRWAGEWHETRVPLFEGSIVRQGRGGRGGFGGAGYVGLDDGQASETSGQCLAAHLAWPGDGRLCIETRPDGTAQLQMGVPGAVMIAPAEKFMPPPVLLAMSGQGRAPIRAAFHGWLRAARAASGVGQGPRPVHLNSWEAMYFAMDEARLKALATSAAALGVERFVVDDGWFQGRTDDRRALGDWAPDSVRFPAGLGPVIAHVRGLGMGFGLWVEPEMVSPDSDLARAHPDWVLGLASRSQPTQRQQWMLYLTRPEISDHVFNMLDNLLMDNNIDYLKWDCNRDIFPAADSRAPVLAMLALIDRLRAAHPHVEIEACASGGGRSDFAMMTRCARLWPSDMTDPLVRWSIHDCMGLFLPPEVIGAHVGASPNPISGRRASMLFRARAMLAGHLGVEADPARMTDSDRATLASEIARWKDWRAVLATGAMHRLEAGEGAAGWLCVASDGATAVGIIASISGTGALEQTVQLHGLSHDSSYVVTIPKPWPSRTPLHPDWADGRTMTGAALMAHGIALPLAQPESAFAITLSRIIP
ncbi:alpha-galactosidase [Sandarakinorhabdus sp.]|uniref:alpha-galactosidase n=1 Tax=Sandarakinorhabdus sp. TaxID=1916663 RepID=UPI00286D7CD9|nr:alpha-galactosidase [Sandarakinorhabdus sp.]